jgi:hypothetical protein
VEAQDKEHEAHAVGEVKHHECATARGPQVAFNQQINHQPQIGVESREEAASSLQQQRAGFIPYDDPADVCVLSHGPAVLDNAVRVNDAGTAKGKVVALADGAYRSAAFTLHSF